MPVDLQTVRLRVANRQPITLEETHALFAHAGLFQGRQVIRTARGFIIILDPPPLRQGQQQQDQLQLPRIEITEHTIRGIGVRGNREAYEQMALMAKLRWARAPLCALRVVGTCDKHAGKRVSPSSITIPMRGGGARLLPVYLRRGRPQWHPLSRGHRLSSRASEKAK